jgi:hypothetical protein
MKDLGDFACTQFASPKEPDNLKTAGITQGFKDPRHTLGGLSIQNGGFDLFLLLNCTDGIPAIF